MHCGNCNNPNNSSLLMISRVLLIFLLSPACLQSVTRPNHCHMSRVTCHVACLSQPIRGHCHETAWSSPTFVTFVQPSQCAHLQQTRIKDDGWLPDSAIVSFNMIIVGFEKCLTIISNHSHAKFYCLQTRKCAVIILMTIPFHGDPCKENIVSKMLK